MGGIVDITSSIAPTSEKDREVKPSKAVKIMLENHVNIENITMSSDSNGSSPIFDKNGNMTSISVGTIETNSTELRDMIKYENIPLESAIKVLTSNVARNLKIGNKKGFIKEGLDADLVLMNENFEILTVIAKGKVMIKDKNIIAKSKFQ
jgi:beta-aspartyl-dipeptidase (metallo-type)